MPGSFPVPLPSQGKGPGNELGLYGEAPSERDTFFGLQVLKRVGILQAEVYKRVGKLSFRYLNGPLIIIFRIALHEKEEQDFLK